MLMTRDLSQHTSAHLIGVAPPMHALHPVHQGAHLPGQRGGLAGGAVVLTIMPGMWGGTGYGYLGMDITDPASWPRPFRPTGGMISYLNGAAE